jgi:hypothetical protein
MFATVDSSSGWWILALAISLTNVLGAAAVVCYARKTCAVRSVPAASSGRPAPQACPPSFNADEVRLVLQRLKDLAATTAEDVGQHSTRIETVSARIAASTAAGDAPTTRSRWAAASQMLEANRNLKAELAET